MDENLRKSIAQATDDQLIDIVFLFPGEYSPDASEAAEAELRKRYRQEAQWDALQAAVQQKSRDREAFAAVPLSWYAKVLFFLSTGSCLGLFVAVLVLELRYRPRGSSRKYREGWICVGYGLAAVVILACLYSAVALLALSATGP
jgi:hypothetical protein